MKKKSKLLHVVSIIIIVFGALAVISSIFSILMRDLMDASYDMLGMTPPPTVLYLGTCSRMLRACGRYHRRSI